MSDIDVRKTLKRRNSLKKEAERSRKMLRKYPKVMVAELSKTFDKGIQTKTRTNSRDLSEKYQNSRRNKPYMFNKKTQKREMRNQAVSTSMEQSRNIKLDPMEVNIPGLEENGPKYELVGSQKKFNQKLKRENSEQLFRLLQAESKDLVTTKQNATSRSNIGKKNPNRTPYTNPNKTAKHLKNGESEFNNNPTETKKVVQKSQEQLMQEHINKEIYREGKDLSKSSKDNLIHIPLDNENEEIDLEINKTDQSPKINEFDLDQAIMNIDIAEPKPSELIIEEGGHESLLYIAENDIVKNTSRDSSVLLTNNNGTKNNSNNSFVKDNLQEVKEEEL